MILSENAIRIANYFLMWLETEYGENYSDIYYINYGGGGGEPYSLHLFGC